MKDYKQTITRARAGRAGMTLIEILIAMGILAMGLFGVLSLFPVAIRNVGMSVNRTKAVGMATDAIYSMRQRHLNMQMVGFTGVRTADTERFKVATNPNVTRLSTLTGMRSFPHLIQWFIATNGNDAVGWGAPVGSGRLSGPTFKIGHRDFLFYDWNPEDDTIDNDGYVPVLEYDHLSGEWLPTQFGWTATFLPLDDNFNAATAQEVAKTNYRVQVAVWRNYKLRYDGSLPQGDRRYRRLDAELNGDAAQRIVTLNAPVPNARPGDYFRVDMHGVWYRIESISGNEVTLVAPFRHPAAQSVGDPVFDPGAAADPITVSIASSHRLIGIYEALITPEK